MAVALFLVLAPSALATSGQPVMLATPYSATTPSVAVDSNGTAYIAWANQKNLAPTTVNLVEYCVLPRGSSACSAHGSLSPASGAGYVSTVSVVLDGSTVSLLAGTDGAQGPRSASYKGIQEWQSTDGGTTFNSVNGGVSVAYSPGSALNGVVLPGGSDLGIGWVAAAAQPSFNAFPLVAPPECSQSSCQSGGATLEPASNPDPIGNPAGQVASQLGANPGVMAIFDTNFTNGPFGCSNAQAVPFGEAFAYASGVQSATNDYNLSPGTTNSAWQVPATKADCNVSYAAVAGGPSGFGILEQNELNKTTVYHRFDQANKSFDTPQVTVAKHGEESAALSQDGAGNLYATYLNDHPGDPIDLAYSADGGSSWISAPINASPGGDVFHVASAVGSSGQGWASWVSNGSIYAQQFVAADAVPSPTPVTINTSQTAGTLAGVNLVVPAGTTGETDHATLAGSHAGSATGTLTYGLYDNPACAAVNQVFNGGAKPVTAGNAAPSDPVPAALSPGRYYWKASYSGNASSLAGAGNLAGASACGSEVLTVSPFAVVAPTATTTGTTVTVIVSCISTPCTITLTITIPSGAARDARAARAKLVTLAGGTVRINRHGKNKVILKLTQQGRRRLKSRHAKLTAAIGLSEKINGHVVYSSAALKIKHR